MSESREGRKRDITGVIFLAFALILGTAYYLPAGATGFLGGALRSLGYGLFGFVARGFPILFIYMAFEFLLGKKVTIASRRVFHVVLAAICLGAIFPSFTISSKDIHDLCLDPLGNKALATRAIALLYRSGNDSSILGLSAQYIFPGGLIGGSISLGLMALAGKTGSLIILFAFLITQIVYIFNVSLSMTANKTADVLKKNTRRAANIMRDRIRVPETQKEAFFPQDVSKADYDTPDIHIGDMPVGGENERGSSVSFSTINLDMPDAARENSEDIVYTSSESVRPEPAPAPLQRKLAFGDEDEEDHSPVQDPHVQTDFTAPPLNPMPVDEFNIDFPDFLRDDSDDEYSDIQENPDGIIVEPDVFPEECLDIPTVKRVVAEERDISQHIQDKDETSEIDPEEESDISRHIQDKDETSEIDSEEESDKSVKFSSSNDDTEETKPEIQTIEEQETKTVRVSVPLKRKIHYKTAPSHLLRTDSDAENRFASRSMLASQGKKLEETLASFGVIAKVVNITHGPSITRFELTPGPGIKVSKIMGLSDDLALAMASVGVRIEAPIPGKSAIGIEIPNKETSIVTLKSLIDAPGFRKNPSPLLAALGKDIPGTPIYCDLSKMPHLLIAGATGSGKSVCINSILISILCRATPEQVRLLMIDPKVVELSIYNGIPHLLAPVVTDPKKAANTLNWAVGEMTRRYGLFAGSSVRDFRGFNEEQKRKKEEALPLILIVIDELADLMQVASKEVEDSISRLTAMARAAGIHLLIATQRPSVDVITGVIKANIPSRIAFAVSSQVDSRTILDCVGAEKLLGKGDMLYNPLSAAKPQRGQGAFVSDAEVEEVISHWKKQFDGEYDPQEAQEIISTPPAGKSSQESSGGGDELLPQAMDIIMQAGYASASILQRRMNIGYPRAARLVDQIYEKGYIGPFDGSKPRKLLISESEWLEIKSKGE